MFPFSPPNQLRDRGDGDAVSLSYLALFWSVWALPNKQYLAGLRLCNLTVWPISATLAIISALGYAIENIVQIFAKPEVQRVAARTVVASVEYVDSVRDGAIGKRPSQSMGLPQFLAVPCRTISAAVLGQLPRPARVGAGGLVHVGPKSLYPSGSGGRVTVMAKSAIMLVAQALCLVLPNASADFANPHGDDFASYGIKDQW